ncbi:UPF0496 protein At3g19330 [Manihot esculenta]|uniref:Uncharacterized protein n=1 Tax=Manihot esculenta TaxID=3983 RepID=A0A2C9V0I2_MANES|nr:UPF0496 protein At3g19330 [Manihot esculenta]OAY37108.1 hypothetical protein MANES_11G075800v8 [Manihot esculenta]
MLQCLSLKLPSAASTSQPNLPATTIEFHQYNDPPPSQGGTSTDGTPVSSTLQSPTVNLTREYTLAVESNSYNEIWSKIQISSPQEFDGEQIEFHSNNDDEAARQLLLAQVLHPNRECVEEALRDAVPNTLTRLVSNYFDHSENTTHLCLRLHRSVYRARALYDPFLKLLDVLPQDSDCLTESQCNYAYEIFLEFDRCDNPFPCPDSHNFQDIRHSFSQLRQQLDDRLRKSRSRVSLVRRATAASALCIIGSAVTVTFAAVAIATHSLIAIVACPFCTVLNLPRKLTKKELEHVKQLDAAARGTYVLNNDLDTIDRLVARLHDSVECDKHLIQLGLERGNGKHPISEVLKHLQKNHLNFIDQLKDLEEHICLCFNAVNKARSLLLREIHVYQNSNS